MNNLPNLHPTDDMPERIRNMDSDVLWIQMICQMGLSMHMRGLAKVGPLSVEALEELADTTGCHASLLRAEGLRRGLKGFDGD